MQRARATRISAKARRTRSPSRRNSGSSFTRWAAPRAAHLIWRDANSFQVRHHVGVRKAWILVLLALALVAPAAATTGQGLYGVVTRSPTKPVCSSEEPCSGPAAHTKLRFFRGTTFVSSVVTDARGRYRMRLPPGLYRVRVAG